MQLRYGCLEGEEYGVYLRGNLVNNDEITLPDYWAKLVDESTITVTLTAIGYPQKLYVEKIENNKVYIKNDNWSNNKISCSYVIYGERKDIDKIILES
jgi:hypothetical protein